MRSSFANMKRKKFGELEDLVIHLFVNTNRPLTVREVHQLVGSKRAYTTLLTVVIRLYKKGTLIRTKEGRSFEYSLKAPKQHTFFSKAKKLFRNTSPTQVFSYFLREEADISVEELATLEKMIQEYKEKKQ